MSYSIKVSGITLSGTDWLDLVHKAKLIDPNFVADGFYYSSSKGLIRIADMQSSHLCNALLRKYRDWVASLSPSRVSEADLARAIIEGPSDTEFRGLFGELIRRLNRGELE